ATSRLSGRRVRLPMNFAIRVRVDASGCERDRAGNCTEVVTRDPRTSQKKRTGLLAGTEVSIGATPRRMERRTMRPSWASRGTGPVTPRGVVTRDSESFGPRFRAARGTIKVPLGPRKVSVELESAAPATGLAEVLCWKAENAKRREKWLSAF